MRTIFTKYIPATYHKEEAKMRASSERLSVTIPYPYEGRDIDNHKKAVKKFCEKYGWRGKLHGGHVSIGMVWVFEDEENTIEV